MISDELKIQIVLSVFLLGYGVYIIIMDKTKVMFLFTPILNFKEMADMFERVWGELNEVSV